ncbi:ATP-binding protein [Paenibacillus sp. J5C_2022]|uniref:ATP-binding protein n=1 Tax=Paenibacillus sp. J5C2022 TaxID=2977129 RepID=UPI0021CE2621|nr:ATP-binding protein [Paenibacillus sp. J5C2022]MCU6708751.1 ATP-binding protein [Paenibacillus sp. J5C2022]
MKKLPIGIDNFKELVEKDCYYADNSSLLQQLENSGAKVTLITRPRRFGKTLTLSMVNCFYNVKENSRGLFAGLQVEGQPIFADAAYYPVLFFSMKELKDSAWETTYRGIQMLMADLYTQNHEVMSKLEEHERSYYTKIMQQTSDEKELQMSLKKLTEYLERYYQKKVIVLIDEYDTPIISGYSHGYFEQVIGFMRNYLSAALKTNPSLNFALLTGITRVSKENIFSGLNHLKIASVMNGVYGDQLGFSERQVEQMLDYYGLGDKKRDVKNWYNGYNFGKYEVYNPWSILNFIDRQGTFGLYWVNTSSEDLIKLVLRKNVDYCRAELEKLIAGDTIETVIDEHVNYNILETEKEKVWSLFVQSGYLNIAQHKVTAIDDPNWGQLEQTSHIVKIPNREIRILYINIIRKWLDESAGSTVISRMLKELTEGDLDAFREMFSDVVLQYFSYYNVSSDKSEQFYHAFALGLFVQLVDRYEVRSEPESGYGRIDLLLTPRDKSKRGIIIELKRMKAADRDVEAAARDALAQIDVKRYEAELVKTGVSNIVKIGIGFMGKSCTVLIS